MTNLSKWSSLFMTIFLFSSCSTESDDATIIEQPILETSSRAPHKIIENPRNYANEYDSAGVLHNKLVAVYLQSPKAFTSISQTIQVFDQIGNDNFLFPPIKSANYNLPTACQIDGIFRNESEYRSELINALHVSQLAKRSLKSFIDSLAIYKNHDAAFDIIYNYIVTFEAAVIDNPAYTADDCKVLLTTSSIARHAFHLSSKRKRPRDRDWDISWGSIFAGGSGSEEEMAKGIIMSAVTGVMASTRD